MKSLLKVFESRYDSYKNKYANSINTKYKTNSKLDIMNDIVEV
ncbi:hypothetical protein FLAVO9AF_790001 [Flavobacterium sp. 9AF]|nr:hypothetical protein FLAVO9AF_790001 [Flavobacterium sp. 9AF]